MFNTSRELRRSLIGMLLMSVFFFTTGIVAAEPATDVSGHWAQSVIERWQNDNLIKGYPDGTFHPNQSITRAEFVSLINQSFHFSESSEVTFKDIKSNDWFYNQVLLAKHAGYINGYPDNTFGPDQIIKRGEMASIITRLLQLSDSNSSDRFSDFSKLPSWSVGAIGAVEDNGLMKGYENGAFESNNTATRAEAVVTIDRALNHRNGSTTYSTAGKYGPDQGVLNIQGDVTVEVPGVTLQNLIITGKLILAKTIGEGDANLNNVVVKGTTSVQGGGSNSIHIINSSFQDIHVQKDKNSVRLAFKGETTVSSLWVQSNLKVEKEDKATKVKFNEVTIPNAIAKKSSVQLEGTIGKLEIASSDVQLNLNDGTVSDLHVSQNVLGANITVNKNVIIDKATLDGLTTIVGGGSIQSLIVNINGSNVEIQPTQLFVKEGIKVIVGGKEKTNLDSTAIIAVPITIGGGTPAVGTGPQDVETAPSNQNLVFSNSQTLQLGTPLSLNIAPATGVTAWIAPVNTINFTESSTMTRLIGNGSTIVMGTPTTLGAYRLFLINSAGVSNPTDAILTITSVVSITSNVDILFANSKVTKGGATIALDSAPLTGYTVWFAPIGTTTFSEGSTMTKLVGDGNLKIMVTPSVEGNYKFFVVSNSGTLFSPSIATLTVDTTAPSTQDTFFIADKTVKVGASITLAHLLVTGDTAWFAPAGTTVFVSSATMTKLVGGGVETSITSPSGEGSYKFYLIDSVGNISIPSIMTLQVDNTAPTVQNTVLSSDKSVKGGTIITLSSAPAVGEVAWLAPSGTANFIIGSTMTKLVGTGSMTTISAPSVEAGYKIYILDAVGNISLPSNATVTVDDTAPIDQDAILTANLAQGASATIILSASPLPGETIWIASPLATVFNNPSATMTSSTSSTITVPSTSASYKIFVIDAAGNISFPSQASIIVN